MEQQQDKKQQSTAKKIYKVVKIVGNVIFYVVIIAVIVAALIGLIGKFKGKNQTVSVFGYSYFVVATNSMERKNEEFADFLEGHDDQIMVGDLIVTRNIPDDYDLKLYDIVTFNRSGDVIVHRIVDIQTNIDGTVLYLTRGDSNNASDGWRSRDEFLGIMVKNAGQKPGVVIKFVQSTYGIMAIALSIAVIIVASLVSSSIKKKKDIAQEPDVASDADQDAARDVQVDEYGVVIDATDDADSPPEVDAETPSEDNTEQLAEDQAPAHDEAEQKPLHDCVVTEQAQETPTKDTQE